MCYMTTVMIQLHHIYSKHTIVLLLFICCNGSDNLFILLVPSWAWPFPMVVSFAHTQHLCA